MQSTVTGAWFQLDVNRLALAWVTFSAEDPKLTSKLVCLFLGFQDEWVSSLFTKQRVALKTQVDLVLSERELHETDLPKIPGEDLPKMP